MSEEPGTIGSWLKSKLRPAELFFSNKNIYIDPENKKFRRFKQSKILGVMVVMYASYYAFWY